MIRAINYQKFSKFVKVTELTSKILSVLFWRGRTRCIISEIKLTKVIFMVMVNVNRSAAITDVIATPAV